MLEFLRNIRRTLAVAMGLFIIYMSLRAGLNLTQYVSDKTMHFVAYGSWAAVACATPRGKQRMALYAGIIFATGLAIEIIQPNVGRDKSMLDLLANSLGIAAGILLALWARRWLYAPSGRQ
jgi:VanZ family protein